MRPHEKPCYCPFFAFIRTYTYYSVVHPLRQFCNPPSLPFFIDSPTKFHQGEPCSLDLVTRSSRGEPCRVERPGRAYRSPAGDLQGRARGPGYSYRRVISHSIRLSIMTCSPAGRGETVALTLSVTLHT